MKLNELRKLINQTAIQYILENKIQEASFNKTATGKEINVERTSDEQFTTQSDDDPESEVDQNVAINAKNMIWNDARDEKLTPDIRKSAVYIIKKSNIQFTPNIPHSDQKEVLDYATSWIVYPYAGDEKAKPYFQHLNSEKIEDKYKLSDEQDSLDNLTADELDLVNVDPITGEASPANKSKNITSDYKTALQRKKITQESLKKAINKIKLVLQHD